MSVPGGEKTIGATLSFVVGEKLLTVRLVAGTHTFECTVRGHAEAGTKVALTAG